MILILLFALVFSTVSIAQDTLGYERPQEMGML